MILFLTMAKKRNSWRDSITEEDRKRMDELLGPLDQKIDLDLLTKANDQAKKYNEQLRTKAKTEAELTVGLECTVQEGNFYQGSTSFTPRSEMVIGGHSSSYSGGHTYHSEITVESETLVEKLQFKGWPPLEAGDTIRAYVLKGKQEYEKNVMDSGTWDNTSHSHWVERDYQATEKPSKIEKLRDGRVVATYHNK